MKVTNKIHRLNDLVLKILKIQARLAAIFAVAGALVFLFPARPAQAAYSCVEVYTTGTMTLYNKYEGKVWTKNLNEQFLLYQGNPYTRTLPQEWNSFYPYGNVSSFLVLSSSFNYDRQRVTTNSSITLSRGGGSIYTTYLDPHSGVPVGYHYQYNVPQVSNSYGDWAKADFWVYAYGKDGSYCRAHR